jgi:hypothetical protein
MLHLPPVSIQAHRLMTSWLICARTVMSLSLLLAATAVGAIAPLPAAATAAREKLSRELLAAWPSA